MNDSVSVSPDERLHIVNERLQLISRTKGLTFGTDAYLLAAFVRPQPRVRAADLGSGTGILSLLLCAKNKIASITAVEVQPLYADLVERNAVLNGLRDRIVPLEKNVRDLTLQDTQGEVGLVVSNPPYMRVGSGRRNQFGEKEIARHEVAGTIDDFCAAAGRILKTGGRFCVVWRPERLRELFSAMEKSRLEPKRMTLVHADEQSVPCAVLVEAIRDGNCGLSVTPPLFLYESQPFGSLNGARRLTAQAQEIYDTCEWSPLIRSKMEQKFKKGDRKP